MSSDCWFLTLCRCAAGCTRVAFHVHASGWAPILVLAMAHLGLGPPPGPPSIVHPPDFPQAILQLPLPGRVLAILVPGPDLGIALVLDLDTIGLLRIPCSPRPVLGPRLPRFHFRFHFRPPDRRLGNLPIAPLCMWPLLAIPLPFLREGFRFLPFLPLRCSILHGNHFVDTIPFPLVSSSFVAALYTVTNGLVASVVPVGTCRGGYLSLFSASAGAVSGGRLGAYG